MFFEKTLNSEQIFKGKLLKVRVDRVLLPDQRESSREIVEHPGAAAVVPLNENGEVFLVRQYRKPVEESLLEIPAGTLEPGEDPRKCAYRELIEETGYKAGNIKKLITFYTTPGICTEIMHIYLATELEKTGNNLLDKDEFLEVESYQFKEVFDLILEGKIRDAKTIIGILLTSYCRDTADQLLKE